jgi:hypothetical protein
MISMIERRSAVAALMYSVAVLAIAVASVPAWSASTNPTVTIVNTTANPVPVSGSITVGNSVVPVEVSNADPIPVQTSPRTYGHFVLGFDGTSDIIVTVPAGKRAFVTDVMMEGSGAERPRVFLVNQCSSDNTQAIFLAGWYLPTIGSELFQHSEHLTSGIPLTAGQCLRAGIIGTASVNIVWYVEDAN